MLYGAGHPCAIQSPPNPPRPPTEHSRARHPKPTGLWAETQLHQYEAALTDIGVVQTLVFTSAYKPGKKILTLQYCDTRFVMLYRLISSIFFNGLHPRI